MNADQTQVIFVEKETGDIIWKKILRKPSKRQGCKFIAYSTGSECGSNTSYVC